MEIPMKVVFDYEPIKVNPNLVKFKDTNKNKCYISHTHVSNVQGLTCIKQLECKDHNKYAEIRIYELSDDDINSYKDNDIYHYLFNPNGKYEY